MAQKGFPKLSPQVKRLQAEARHKRLRAYLLDESVPDIEIELDDEDKKDLPGGEYQQLSEMDKI